MPYRSLTALDSVQRFPYEQSLLLKQQAKSFVHKDGFIAKSEVQGIADANGESKNNLLKKIRRLVDQGFVEKNKYGYTLVSTKKLNRKLKLSSVKKGKEHTPFLKIENARSLRHIELLRLYFLIIQIRRQHLYRKNGRITRRSPSPAPEYFELSLDKICEKGKYNSKTTVNGMIGDLVALGLLKRIKGKFNNTKVAHYDCNQYQFTRKGTQSINWDLLDAVTQIDYKKLFREINDGISEKKAMNRSRVGLSKRKIIYTEIEKRLHEFLRKGCQDILVDNGVLSRHFRSFGSKPGRKITRNMFPKVLTAILNDVDLRKIFFTRFEPKDVLVNEDAEGVVYNANLNIPRYRALNSFKYDHVELVNDKSGNYSEYQDVILNSRESICSQLRRNFFMQELSSVNRIASS